MHICGFQAPVALTSLRQSTFASSSVCPTRSRGPRAALDLIPGVPPGEDARTNAPLRYYVPRPKEDYSNRSFATPLPVTWEGEVPTIGAADIEPMTKESIAESKRVPEDNVSIGALSEFARMVAEERKAALAALNNPDPSPGRATCGESEGRAFVSNYRKDLVFGVKCVGYWEKPASEM